MLIPDFTRYSLALLEGEKLIYSAYGGGLRPLWDALERFQGKSGLILHDKVIGLAAARLIVQSGMIAAIFTRVASLPAKQFLENNGVALTAFDVAANILTQDKSTLCPGEVIALNTSDPDAFLQKIKAMMA
ncbi:MAG: DUF1893 domain-containing protein [Deltaproteobacteria bacterium]|nr:MAG: DUF1893 domain-containing protein [Deltaproteobacteria bacterium]